MTQPLNDQWYFRSYMHSESWADGEAGWTRRICTYLTSVRWYTNDAIEEFENEFDRILLISLHDSSQSKNMHEMSFLQEIWSCFVQSAAFSTQVLLEWQCSFFFYLSPTREYTYSIPSFSLLVLLWYREILMCHRVRHFIFVTFCWVSSWYLLVDVFKQWETCY